VRRTATKSHTLYRLSYPGKGSIVEQVLLIIYQVTILDHEGLLHPYYCTRAAEHQYTAQRHQRHHRFRY
jgi:hypothetical protein